VRLGLDWSGLPGNESLGKAWESKMGIFDFMSNKKTSRETRDQRYTVSAKGVIKDRKTGLEWVVGEDYQVTSYNKAEAWVHDCKIAGGGWRMPTEEELKGLYVEGLGTRNIDPVFETTGWGVYAALSPGESASGAWPWSFEFGGGYVNPEPSSRMHGRGRAFAVRTAKK
jgi:hypothetical protein